jgi:putative ABC transport system permease protein
MDTIRTFAARIASLFRRGRLDAELDEEVGSHIDLAVDAKVRGGMPEKQARQEAMREFGAVAQMKESYRMRRGLPFFEVAARDLHYAFRQLWKSPGFTLTTVLTLAIGVGVNTAIFSMMDAVVLRPLAIPDLSRVVTVAEDQGQGDYHQVALANYESWKQQSRSFESLAVRSDKSMGMTAGAGGEASHVDVSLTSPNFFTVMETQPLLGRVYGESESQPGSDGELVLSYSYWQKHMGADPAVLGRTINLDQRAYTIIGVMPKLMQYPSTSDMFLPLAPTAQQEANRVSHDYLVVGRLHPGVAVNQAQEELRVIANRLAKAYPASNLGWSVRVEPLLDGINGDLTPLYYRLILAATGFVLLVVCANVANLQFVRGIQRRPEIAIRVALGAGRRRLLRHLLTENLLLGVMGAVGGIGVAAVAMHLSKIAMPERVAKYMAGWSNISLNGRALAYSLLVALIAGLVSGLLPALRALRVDIVEQLKAGSRSASGSRPTQRLRDIFAVAQIAMSVLLVIGAALMSKGMWSLLHVADRYQPKQVLTFKADLPVARYKTDEQMAAWYSESLAKLRALPGVTHVEITTMLPDGNDQWLEDFRIENRPLMPGKFQSAVPISVSAGYFDALHIAQFAGRIFNSEDALGAQPVAVVSRTFAERYFPGQSALGRRIQMGTAGKDEMPWVRIVGIVDDVNYLWIDRTVEPDVYLNASQMPPRSATFMVTTTGDPLALGPAVRRQMAALDPSVPLDEMQTYQQYLTVALTGMIYVAVTLSVNAFIGLLLAAMGIFGVMGNLVAERTREIGVRIALGARPQDMLAMILRRAALLTGVGVTLGIVLAAAMARLIANLIFGVQPYDPVVFVSITAAIIAIALLVSWVPARRAALVDPMRTLRTE